MTIIDIAGTSLLGDVIKGIQDSGCSLFFLTSSALSIYNGEKNRANSWENALKDQEFQDELQEQKERYEDFKEAKEKAFRIWLRNKQRDYSRIETSTRLENELAKSELQMFFADWPLQIAIETLNEKRLKLNIKKETVALYIVIGKYNVGKAKDAISKSYSSIVDEVKLLTKETGIPETNILRFKEDVNVIGGPALANIYAMMSSFPTLVLLPKFVVSDNLIVLSIGVWNQDSLFPMQKEVYNIECNYTKANNDKAYLQSKLEELKYAYATISIVINDTYSLIESFATPNFPKFAIKHSISDKYPHLIDFAKKEYNSLLNSLGTLTNDSIVNELYTSSDKNVIVDIVIKTIKQLQKWD